MQYITLKNASKITWNAVKNENSKRIGTIVELLNWKKNLLLFFLNN